MSAQMGHLVHGIFIIFNLTESKSDLGAGNVEADLADHSHESLRTPLGQRLPTGVVGICTPRCIVSIRIHMGQLCTQKWEHIYLSLIF